MEPRTSLFLSIRELQRRKEKAELGKLYPDEGPLRRELYVKHLKMFEAGRIHNERCALGGNRIGKTLGIGGYETALHATGEYPHWWVGRTFKKPIEMWAAGTKALKVREVNQKFLLGKLTKRTGYTIAQGGLIPQARIVRLTRKTGVADAVDQAVVRHKLGFENVITFKSYEEGRSSFEAEAIDWIWLDEEPPREIYDECKMRILTARGAILSTYTPLEGMSATTLSILEGSEFL